MTTGYIVEIKLGGDLAKPVVKYLSNKGKLSSTPKVFSSASQVKRNLIDHPGYGQSHYHLAYSNNTTIIKIESLELGLKTAPASSMSFEEFMKSTADKKIKNNKNAVYKIIIKNDNKIIYVNGSYRNRFKYGKIWNSAGAVRNHINSNIIKLNVEYKNAIVLEIEMMEDGVTPSSITEYNIVDFYCASKESKLKYDQYVKHVARVQAAIKRKNSYVA